MLLDCDTEWRRHRPRLAPFERLRLTIAHLLHERVAMLGDRRAAIAAMGAFYARTSGPLDIEPLDLDAAVDALTASRGVTSTGIAAPERRSDERLLLAARRIGCAVVRLAREAVDARDERAAALRRLDRRTLDRRLTSLLSEGTRDRPFDRRTDRSGRHEP